MLAAFFLKKKKNNSLIMKKEYFSVAQLIKCVCVPHITMLCLSLCAAWNLFDLDLRLLQLKITDK